jgi:glutamyl-tRNA reductase
VNLLVVGISYRTAPVAVLEQVAVAGPQVPALLDALLGQASIGGAVVLSTCNRVEVYAAVTAFHGGLSDIGAVLAQRAGCAPAELAPHLYVRYDAEAVRHAYRVAAGLDSMVVGESQVLGQLREAYATATDSDTAGPLLHELMQQALRVGKRAHAETGLDRAGASVVTAGLALASEALAGQDFAGPPASQLAGARVLVVGAGSMGALAVATLRRAGAQTRVTTRNTERARRLAANYGAVAVPLESLTDELAMADLVVCATAAIEPVLRVADMPAGHGLVIVDLAVPRDVEPAVGELPGVTLIDLDTLATHPAGVVTASADQAAAEAIVASEVEAFLAWRVGADAAPTVAALRARADEVVAAELTRLRQRRPDLTEAQRGDVAQAIHRVVQQLLHRPSVRVRQLAAEPGGDQYTRLLRDLFDLNLDGDHSFAGNVTDVAGPDTESGGR